MAKEKAKEKLRLEVEEMKRKEEDDMTEIRREYLQKSRQMDSKTVAKLQMKDLPDLLLCPITQGTF